MVLSQFDKILPPGHFFLIVNLAFAHIQGIYMIPDTDNRMMRIPNAEETGGAVYVCVFVVLWSRENTVKSRWGEITAK